MAATAAESKCSTSCRSLAVAYIRLLFRSSDRPKSTLGAIAAAGRASEQEMCCGIWHIAAAQCAAALAVRVVVVVVARIHAAARHNLTLVAAKWRDSYTCAHRSRTNTWTKLDWPGECVREIASSDSDARSPLGRGRIKVRSATSESLQFLLAFTFATDSALSAEPTRGTC